ncbi:Clp protease N-terminal domain-containing protein [Allorhizocola rhizosphaerae]|uniref:Clp protease N-terminal domain-containing protein n=1 Tax=Allorhizocola rhizosphaerae TaxID=1872709 RepID=UPI003CCC8051
MDREFEQSLAAAGVSLAAFDLPRTGPVGTRDPQPGESVRLAIERGLASVARQAEVRPAHLLLGILSAQVGTVPRALALAGVDRAALTTRVEQTLAGGRA